MQEFRFSNDHNPSQAAAVIDVLRRPRLWIPTEQDYPGHDEWLGKVEDQVLLGTKRAMVARAGSVAIGAAIYQRHPDDSSVLEVRNLSIAPDARGRFIGSFLLRNTEIEGVHNDFPGTNIIIVDTKITNTDMINFLLKHGYKIQEITDLYKLGAGMDVVLAKDARSLDANAAMVQ